jgi:hypothetical protein
MGMGTLLLPGFKTVHVTEQTFGVEEVNLPHLVSGKADLGQYIFEDFHRVPRYLDQIVQSGGLSFDGQMGYQPVHLCPSAKAPGDASPVRFWDGD